MLLSQQFNASDAWLEDAIVLDVMYQVRGQTRYPPQSLWLFGSYCSRKFLLGLGDCSSEYLFCGWTNMCSEDWLPEISMPGSSLGLPSMGSKQEIWVQRYEGSRKKCHDRPSLQWFLLPTFVHVGVSSGSTVASTHFTILLFICLVIDIKYWDYK